MAKYALVIGVSEYQSSSLNKLTKAAIGAEDVAKLLETDGNFQVERLPKRWNKETNHWEVAEEPVSNTKVINELKTLLWERAAKSEVLIYFAGHGIRAFDELEEPQGLLAVSNCKVQLKEGKVVQHENGIPLDIINRLISNNKCDVSSLVMLLDCCHSGSLLENSEIRKTLTVFASKNDYYLIAGCRSFEKARAFKGEANSIFTGALLKGLSLENANPDGTVTTDLVFNFISNELKDSGQEPIRLGYGRSLVLVSYPESSPALAVEPLRDEKGEIRCPYQGLMPFTKTELPFFFGRKRVVEEIATKLEQQLFIPIIGASGSGKSSVVLAGLVPHLEELGWQVLEPFTPGFKPLARLEEVLRKKYFSEVEELLDECIYDQSSEGLKPLLEHFPKGRYLLVVDQFEELFTVAKKKQRDTFIRLLTKVANLPDSPLAIVVTMRADFFIDCLYYDSLRQFIEKEAKLLSNIKGKDLIDAICEPAKRQGYKVTDELLNQILTDIKQEPGFLPLLEFALAQLWLKRDRVKHQLTLKDYTAIGGILGSVNLHANKVYEYRDYKQQSPNNKRTKEEHKWIKWIFLQLVRTIDGEKDARRRQSKNKLIEFSNNDKDNWKSLKIFVQNEINLLEKNKSSLLVPAFYNNSNPSYKNLSFENRTLLYELLKEVKKIIEERVKEETKKILNELLDGESGLVKARLLVAGKDVHKVDYIEMSHEALMDTWNQLKQWRQKERHFMMLVDSVENQAVNWKKHNEDDKYFINSGTINDVNNNFQDLKLYLSPLALKFFICSFKKMLLEELPFAYSYNDYTPFVEKQPNFNPVISPEFNPVISPEFNPIIPPEF